jgi:hypothetical protein
MQDDVTAPSIIAHPQELISVAGIEVTSEGVSSLIEMIVCIEHPIPKLYRHPTLLIVSRLQPPSTAHRAASPAKPYSM